MKTNNQIKNGMKEPDDFVKDGYEFKAASLDGRNRVSSYIAKKNGKVMYGTYDCKKAAYIEELYQ